MRLTELNQDLVDLDRRLEAAEELYRREFGAVPPGSEPRRGRRRDSSRTVPSPRGRQSWRDAIIAVLTTSNRPMHVKEIWQALLDAGFQTDSQDPLRSIVSIAVRDPGIHRTAPNTYSLNGNTKLQVQRDGDGEVVTAIQGGS